jgi:metal-responsive CopG/Arc/MetJ family transcriptional regulator
MATKKPQILLTLDEDLLKRIEDYRYENRIPTRSETIRTLIKNGLKDKEWDYLIEE